MGYIRLIRKIYHILLSIKLIHYIYSKILSLISRFIEIFLKKDDYLIVFGASNGVSYGDNSKFLFEWIIKNQSKYKCIWLTHRKSIKKQLLNKNYNVALTWSFRGIYSLFRASFGCFTNTLRDISIDPWFFPCKINLISLRHGKSVKGVQASLKNLKLTDIEVKSRNQEKKYVKAVLSTSKKISEITELSLKVGAEKIFITGYPRNDSFFINSKKDYGLVKKIAQNDANKIILYAPSWRNTRVHTHFFPFNDFILNDLIENLEKHKIQILLRPHPNDSIVFPQFNNFIKKLAISTKYIEIADVEIFEDMYTLLPFVDCLITDYSATYHDFLLTKKPIWFIPYDYEEFKGQNGFLYDYFSLLPGPNIKTLADFICEMDNLSKGIDKYLNKREKLTNIIHKYRDGESSKRVYDLIDSIN